MSSCGSVDGGSVCPGGVFVVGGSVFETSVDDADESVSESSQCLVVEVAGCSPLVVERSWLLDCSLGNRTPIGPGRRRDAGYGPGEPGQRACGLTPL